MRPLSSSTVRALAKNEAISAIEASDAHLRQFVSPQEKNLHAERSQQLAFVVCRRGQRSEVRADYAHFISAVLSRWRFYLRKKLVEKDICSQ